MAIASPPPAGEPFQLPRRRWTRAQYYRVAEVGLFQPDERLELLDGEIIQTSPKGARHVMATRRTLRALTAPFSVLSVYCGRRAPSFLPTRANRNRTLPLHGGLKKHTRNAILKPLKSCLWRKSPTSPCAPTGSKRDACTPAPKYRSTGSSTFPITGWKCTDSPSPVNSRSK